MMVGSFVTHTTKKCEVTTFGIKEVWYFLDPAEVIQALKNIGYPEAFNAYFKEDGLYRNTTIVPVFKGNSGKLEVGIRTFLGKINEPVECIKSVKILVYKEGQEFKLVANM